MPQVMRQESSHSWAWGSRGEGVLKLRKLGKAPSHAAETQAWEEPIAAHLVVVFLSSKEEQHQDPRGPEIWGKEPTGLIWCLRKAVSFCRCWEVTKLKSVAFLKDLLLPEWTVWWDQEDQETHEKQTGRASPFLLLLLCSVSPSSSTGRA